MEHYYGTQIPVTTGEFDLQAPQLQCSYQTHYAISSMA